MMEARLLLVWQQAGGGLRRYRKAAHCREWFDTTPAEVEAIVQFVGQ